MEPPQLQQDQRRSTIAEVSKTHKDIATTSFIFLPPKLMHSFFWRSCLSLFSKLLPSKRSFVFLDFTYLTFDVFLLLLLLLFLLFFFFFLCCCFFLFVCLLLGPPVVTVFEPNPTNATENQATQFECYGTGLPLPTFSIKKLVPPPGIKRYATLWENIFICTQPLNEYYHVIAYLTGGCKPYNVSNLPVTPLMKGGPETLERNSKYKTALLFIIFLLNILLLNF